jgi:hypothetical protein
VVGSNVDEGVAGSQEGMQYEGQAAAEFARNGEEARVAEIDIDRSSGNIQPAREVRTDEAAKPNNNTQEKFCADRIASLSGAVRRKKPIGAGQLGYQ